MSGMTLVHLNRKIGVSSDGKEVFEVIPIKAAKVTGYMNTVKTIAEQSKCLSRKLGCGIFDPKTWALVALGYNGPPRGVKHPEERNPECSGQCPRRFLGFKSGEGRHICPCGHAERNCISFCARQGHKTEGKIILLSNDIMPCLDCAIDIITAGIIAVFVTTKDEYHPEKNAVKVLDLFQEAKIDVFYLNPAGSLEVLTKGGGVCLG